MIYFLAMQINFKWTYIICESQNKMLDKQRITEENLSCVARLGQVNTSHQM